MKRKCFANSRIYFIKLIKFYFNLPVVSLVCAQVCVVEKNLPYTRRITLKRVTNGGAYLRDLAPGQHRRAFGCNMSDLTGTDLRPPTPKAMYFTTGQTGRCFEKFSSVY